ncbi:MAG: ABC1 kinase family protein [Fibrobacterota bacterium]
MIRINRKLSLGRTYIHFKRYREIVGILIRYGFDNVIESLNLTDVLALVSRKKVENLGRYTNIQRIRMAVEELGPTFVKLAQIVSVRPDLIPFDIARELTLLQDRVPPFSTEDARKIIEEELRAPVGQNFSFFNETPVAAGSVSQIHRARLRDGSDVVIKVQRPGIEKKMEVDLEILYNLADLLRKHNERYSHHNPQHIVEEFARTISRELDFINEAHNITQFRNIFQKNTTIHVPRVYHDCCTSRVLTMEFIDGIKPDDTEALKRRGHNLPRLADRGLSLIFEQIFIYGVFHADPHPGNIFIRDDGKICYIDFGIVGRVTREERENILRLLVAVYQRDEKKLVKGILKFTISTQKRIDTEQLEREFIELMDLYVNSPIESISYEHIINTLFSILNSNGITIKSHIYLMMKTIATAESLGRTLYPDLVVINKIKPFIHRMYRRRLNPVTMGGNLISSLQEVIYIMRNFPEDFAGFTRRLSEGSLSIELEHKGLREITHTLDRISNRISFAIVLAALIIGSSLMIRADIPPYWNDIPLIGLVGFVMAGLIAFALIFSMLRKRNF